MPGLASGVGEVPASGTPASIGGGAYDVNVLTSVTPSVYRLCPMLLAGAVAVPCSSLLRYALEALSSVAT